MLPHEPQARNALLVYPRFPPSYWGFQYAIELMGKRSAMPPLGLLTVAAMFPAHYRLRLVDLNVRALTDEDIDWADLVLTSTMIVQQRSLQEVIAQCKGRGKPVAVGGPHPTSFVEEIAGADYYVVDEVEETLPRFLADWEAGTAQRVYRPESKPPVTTTPVPRFDLLDLDAYSSMALQFSRGCPFDCEFCDITKLFGRVPRTKSNAQMVAELDALYDLGWRGSVFLVDDNFIGNRREALRLLPEVAAWQRQRDYPFDLFTEASVNLAQHEPLLEAMAQAGFRMVFLGIESPNPEALKLTKKTQNIRRGDGDFLLHAVQAIQRKGIEVSGGFILGLDGDGPEVFEAQVAFIQEAGIPRAMVGLLTALRGTDLYARLEAEGRLLGEASGNNVEVALNYRPQLEPEVLIDGYRRVLAALYPPDLASYFARCWTLLSNLGPGVASRRRVVKPAELLALLRSLRRQGLSRQAPAYLGFLLRTLLRRPRQFPQAMGLAIMGLHFEKFTRQTLAAHDFSAAARTGYGEVEREAAAAATPLAPGTESQESLQETLRRHANQAVRRLRRLHRRLRPEFRKGLSPDLAGVEQAIQACVREAPALEPLQRMQPHAEQWFAGPSWRGALEAHGYALAERWRAGARTLTLAPLLAQGSLRRALERFLGELGVQVMTWREQVAHLGEEKLESLLAPGDAPDRLASYLRALGRSADTLIVPLAGELDGTGERVQLLSPHAAGIAEDGALPQVVGVACNSSRPQLRASLIELGAALTGDPGRAEIAFDRAFALL
ncbi:MAG TPA: B12-binding domain-containing radical SAM protein [Thermoanaerobaculia bacterium]|nr:B12-binding domain-containing radical SAM protein [Thermoanaerobaculia bacterium]